MPMPYGKTIWQDPMAMPYYNKAIWQRHIAKPYDLPMLYGKAICQCYMSMPYDRATQTTRKLIPCIDKLINADGEKYVRYDVSVFTKS